MMPEVVNIQWVTTNGVPMWVEVTLSNGQICRYERVQK